MLLLGESNLFAEGVSQSDFVFNDEEQLKNFLSLNEEQKTLNIGCYKAQECWLLQYLNLFWEVDLNFEGKYKQDYDLLQNNTDQPEKTAWIDKYTTTLFSRQLIPIPRYDPQPLPDYIRWMKTCEFHYMTSEEVSLLQSGPWHDIPGIFIPSRILDICYTIFRHPKK